MEYIRQHDRHMNIKTLEGKVKARSHINQAAFVITEVIIRNSLHTISSAGAKMSPLIVWKGRTLNRGQLGPHDNSI